MNFKEQLNELVKKIEKYRPQIKNEEMTKNALILPFFDVLGYDTRNPFEFHPEYTADIADYKGERVDYAILINNELQILIEAKPCDDLLDKYDKQLARYFNATKSKLGILTNGVVYKIFTDLDKPNVMDEKPFLEIDLFKIKDHEINELRKFSKANFDLGNILTSAEELKYSNLLKKHLRQQFDSPDERFVSYLIGEVYEGVKTQKVKDKFESIIKSSLDQFLNDIVRNKLEVALEPKIENSITKVEPVSTNSILEEGKPQVETTLEELEGFGIIKAILREELPEIKRIAYRDAQSYFAILLDDNARKWICRLYLNTAVKYISFPELDETGKKTNKEIKVVLKDSIDSIYDYKEEILSSFRNNLK